jgi:hypothetical protein
MSHARVIHGVEVAEARATLREFIKPGDTVYCNIKHVSRSGMLRIISLSVIDTESRGTSHPDHGKPRLRDITGLAAKAMDDKLDRDRWGLKVGGCGMNMCFATVYNLGRALFPNGSGVEMVTDSAVSDRQRRTTPVSEGEAAKLQKQGWRSYGRNGDPSGWDRDGGYALKHTTI